jgi:hypothetical protein
MLILAFMALAMLMLGRRRSTGLPPSEQFVSSLMHIAAWIEPIGCALDSAIVRYRIERKRLVIELESTQKRLEGERL